MHRTLSILEMLVHPHQKSLYQFERNVHAYLHAKNQLQSTSLEIFQRNSQFVFWALWACLAKHKMILKI